MSMSDPKATQIVADAEALIQKVQADLAQSDSVFTNAGLNPEKAKAVLSGLTTPKQFAEADAAVKADLAAIEQEVAEEAARRNQGGTSGGAKKPRMMI